MSTPVIAAEIGATKAANVNEPDVSPVTQYCVSSDGSDAMFLGSALDAFESGAALEGSGDSAILSVPIHKCPTPSFGSEASETTTSCDSSGGVVPLLDLKRKLGDSGLLTPSKISKLSTSFNTLHVKALRQQENSEMQETQEATPCDSLVFLPVPQDPPSAQPLPPEASVCQRLSERSHKRIECLRTFLGL